MKFVCPNCKQTTEHLVHGWCIPCLAREAVDAKNKAREEAAAAKQREWIEAHGSILLRGLLREGIDCDRVYRDERLKLERPKWVWEYTVCGRIQDTSVSEEHLAALESARKIDPDVYLAWLGHGEHASSCQCNSDDNDNPVVAQRTILVSSFLEREIVYLA